MRSRLLFYLLLLPALRVFSQADSVMYSGAQPDGIYLSYPDFRRNRFISKEQIVSDQDKEQLEFIGKIINGDRFSYTSEEGMMTVESRKAWGFFQNKTLYVNFRNEFYRVPVFGSICYLVANVPVVSTGFYDPMFGYSANTTRTKEIREFVTNFYDGILAEFTLDTAEELLSRDPQLFAEFKKLNRHKRKEQVNRYIRRYNELHPVYFLN